MASVLLVAEISNKYLKQLKKYMEDLKIKMPLKLTRTVSGGLNGALANGGINPSPSPAGSPVKPVDATA